MAVQLLYRHLFPVMWLAWAGYWLVTAWAVKATARREPLGSRLLHILPLTVAIWLLWAEHVPGTVLSYRLLPLTPWTFWPGALATATGLLFAVWARVHIGRNWSGTVTIKEDHELIVSGPYALVRHPIYSGLLLAIIGSALARSETRGVLAVLIAWLALWRKYRIEERWMTERFGARYDAYRQRVPALVPFLKKRGRSANTMRG
jgi:protein-S-isoprenylcysteine O-methyltransferase Ste14